MPIRLAFLAGLLLANPVVHAATFNVSNAADLIAAINDANSNGQDDTIILDADITLTEAVDGSNGLPVVVADSSHTLTLEGNGHTVARDGAARPFRIIEVADNANLTLNRVTLANGNAASGGGGIFTNGGALTLTNVTILGNTTGGDGGGLVINGMATLTNVTFSNNIANNGGGIAQLGNTITLTNVTFSGNSATLSGGGIFIDATAMATVTNSTISGNSAGNGGGLYNAGSLTVSNTVIANNTSDNCLGVIINGGHNLDSGTSCGWGANNGSLSSTDPWLGPLGKL